PPLHITAGLADCSRHSVATRLAWSTRRANCRVRMWRFATTSQRAQTSRSCWSSRGSVSTEPPTHRLDPCRLQRVWVAPEGPAEVRSRVRLPSALNGHLVVPQLGVALCELQCLRPVASSNVLTERPELVPLACLLALGHLWQLGLLRALRYAVDADLATPALCHHSRILAAHRSGLAVGPPPPPNERISIQGAPSAGLSHGDRSVTLPLRHRPS